MADSSIGEIPAQRPTESLDPVAFRRIMGRFPTGVVIVATRYRGRPYGMSVSSFASASLDPTMLVFCAARGSGTWARVRAAGRFAVSVLGAGQADVGLLFARRGVDRFAAVRWSDNASGQPVLDDAIAWFDCLVADVFPAGDHDLALGRVLDMHERPDGGPLLFHRGELVGFPCNSPGDL